MFGGQNTLGFLVPRQFFVSPVPAAKSEKGVKEPTPFIIISSSNNLLIKDETNYDGKNREIHLSNDDDGAGFSASETALTATFTPNCKKLKLELYFKITDTVNDYRLFIKHWKTQPIGTKTDPKVGIQLHIIINDDHDNRIIKQINTLEAEGGENNLLSISMRDLSYGSVDYHDYLNLGLNKIEITMTPTASDPRACGYQIRAISIERP
jgi:hypothetical protein